MKKAKEQGKPFEDRKQAAAITDDQGEQRTGAVIEGISNMANSSRDYVLAVTEGPRLDNNAIRWKKLIVLMLITFMHEPVSAQDNSDVSWILVGSCSAATACPPTHAQELQIIHGPEKMV